MDLGDRKKERKKERKVNIEIGWMDLGKIDLC